LILGFAPGASNAVPLPRYYESHAISSPRGTCRVFSGTGSPVGGPDVKSQPCSAFRLSTACRKRNPTEVFPNPADFIR